MLRGKEQRENEDNTNWCNQQDKCLSFPVFTLADANDPAQPLLDGKNEDKAESKCYWQEMSPQSKLFCCTSQPSASE